MELETFKPDVIVLGGGGGKGFLLLGALFGLYKSGMLDNVKTICGVSIGSIIGLLNTVGWEMEDIIAKAATTNIFKEIVIPDIDTMKEKMGVLPTTHIRIDLEKCVKDKFGYVPTLKQLHLITGIKFESVTYNMSLKKVEYLSHETYQDMTCVEAAMLSMNIPGVFQMVQHDGFTYVDGGLGNPYPINHYDDGINKVLGLYIESTTVRMKFDVKSYIHAAIQAPMDEMRKLIITHASKRCKNICLKTELIDTLGITMTMEDKAKLVVNGWTIAKTFIDENTVEKKSSNKEEIKPRVVSLIDLDL